MSSQNYLFESINILQGINNQIMNTLVNIYSYLTSQISPYAKQGVRVPSCLKIPPPLQMWLFLFSGVKFYKIKIHLG